MVGIDHEQIAGAKGSNGSARNAARLANRASAAAMSARGAGIDCCDRCASPPSATARATNRVEWRIRSTDPARLEAPHRA